MSKKNKIELRQQLTIYSILVLPLGSLGEWK